MTPRRFLKFSSRLIQLAMLSSLAFLATAAHAKVQPESGVGFPRDVSVHGHEIDSLIIVTGWFVTALFIIMCVWMGIACWKHGRGHQAHYEHGDRKKDIVTASIISGLIFFVVDGNLFYQSVKDTAAYFWNYDLPESDPGVVRIQVNAHQWAWDARYAGADGEFNTADDIVTLNDIRVPVDRPVLVQLAATDVIHSFYLPNLRVKTDAVPGTVNKLWFEAKETGEFDLACAQHCGAAHYLMKGQLTILSDSDYEAWAAHSSEVARLSYDPDDEDAHWGWSWAAGKEM